MIWMYQRDKCTTLSRRRSRVFSEVSPKKMAALIATPCATASSVSMLLLGSLLLTKSDMSLIIWGQFHACWPCQSYNHAEPSPQAQSCHRIVSGKVLQNRLEWEKCRPRSQCLYIVESQSQWRFGQWMIGYMWHACEQYRYGELHEDSTTSQWDGPQEIKTRTQKDSIPFLFLRLNS